MKRIIFLITIVFALFIIANFVTSIYILWQKRDLLIQAQRQLTREEKENIHLKEQLKRVESPAFIEEQARNKLFLVKPGESNLIIPTTTMLASDSSKPVRSANKPHWQEWWELFFR